MCRPRNTRVEFVYGAAGAGGGHTQTIELAMTKSSKNAIFVSEAVTSEFEKQTGIRVKLQLLPTEQVSSVLKTKLAVGEAPDLILYNSTQPLSS